jgi:sporulation protein YlmC with PRC-barrel domain
MLQLSAMLINRPILSLRVGRPIATTLAPILNPNNLRIEGFYCQVEKNRKPLVLLSQDVRDILPQGVVVNDEDVLSETDDLVRLQEILEIHFELLGKQVVTTTKDKLGKVSDYAVETDGLFVQKLYVAQSLFKNFGGGNLGIDRSQITEITNKTIIVNDLRQKVPANARAMA